jgi:hypothetical protein
MSFIPDGFGGGLCGSFAYYLNLFLKDSNCKFIVVSFELSLTWGPLHTSKPHCDFSKLFK